MNTAADLLAFISRLRTARSAKEMNCLAVNEIYSLLPYRLCCLWQADALGRPQLAAASGLSETDANAPFALWFARAAAWLEQRWQHETPGQRRLLDLTAADFPSDLEDGSEWLAPHALILPLTTPEGQSLGGLWLFREEAASEEDLALAAWIGQQTEFALWAWRREQLAWREQLARLSPKSWRALSRPKKFAALALLTAVLAFPVRLSALAPAEITPLKPIPLTAPVDGVVGRVLVSPNQPVQAGQPLVDMDDTATRNRLLVAQKTLDVARADLARAAGKAFSDDGSKSELQLLAARERERTAEVQYLTELLARLKLRAPEAGIALFADAEEWRGKPVQVGERIMTLAEPSQAGVTLYVSPDDAVALDPGAEVAMFLNVSPLASYQAKVVQASYETGTSPEGHPAYIVRATFDPGTPTPRLGLKGTAKIQADRVPLIYYLLRKPLRSLRHAVGV